MSRVKAIYFLLTNKEFILYAGRHITALIDNRAFCDKAISGIEELKGRFLND